MEVSFHGDLCLVLQELDASGSLTCRTAPALNQGAVP